MEQRSVQTAPSQAWPAQRATAATPWATSTIPAPIHWTTTAAAAVVTGQVVTFARSNKKFTWDGSHDSILELAEANGVELDSGCRAGSCGTCITAVKTGEVGYVEEPGSLPESGSCLACISVPKTDLVLDA